MDGTAGHGGGQAAIDGLGDPLPPVPQRSALRNYLKLARLHQWGKGAFVLVGPVYGAVDGHAINWPAVGLAFLGFGLGSSACYVVNDIQDREADRNHPRKRRRPLASGAISVRAAWVFAAVLLLGALGAIAALATVAPKEATFWTGLAIIGYIANVMAYTYLFKHHIIADVVSLALGFVLRVLGGCASTEIEPSTWLLNCTLFVSMFLAFAKRLGERRTVQGDGVSKARAVQSVYTDELLRMTVVVTGVAALVTYAGYVQARGEAYTVGFNLLWLTMLPATYGLLRCIVLVERGDYDDPTELATRDRAFQVAGLAFVAVTIAIAFIADRTDMLTG
jgi:4-hydroxybenzoate polyprenyltransferase